ncbi:MAG: hypothetical protein HY561_10175 [Gemmatimonadetes bacterium]|nr:hypothetical protein [Gemmatimonadota bacterium]
MTLAIGILALAAIFALVGLLRVRLTGCCGLRDRGADAAGCAGCPLAKLRGGDRTPPPGR